MSEDIGAFQPTDFSSDDTVLVNIDGFLQKDGTWPANATINTTIDCGSHCEMYGNAPGERPGSSFSLSFCEMSDIQHEIGRGTEGESCVVKEGRTRITSMVYVFPMFLSVPVSDTFLYPRSRYLSS